MNYRNLEKMIVKCTNMIKKCVCDDTLSFDERLFLKNDIDKLKKEINRLNNNLNSQEGECHV